MRLKLNIAAYTEDYDCKEKIDDMTNVSRNTAAALIVF